MSTSDPFSAEQQAAIVKSQREEQSITLWAVGIFCIFCWDYLTCFAKEVRYIWRGKFTPVSLLYLANRYFGLVQGAVAIWVIKLMNSGQEGGTCEKMFLWQPVGAIIITLLSHTLMAGQVYAAYGSSKLILGVLVTVMAGEFAIRAYTLTTLFPTPPHMPGISIPCTVSGPFAWLTAFWAMPLLFDTITFIFMLVKTSALFRRENHTPKINIFFHDGLVYFATLFFMNLANIVVFITKDAGLRAINLPATIELNAIISCRMLLNSQNLLSGSHRTGISASSAGDEGQVSGWESPFEPERDTFKLSTIQR